MARQVRAPADLTVEGVSVRVEGDLDLQGTLGTRRDVPVGVEEIRLRFDLVAPDLDDASRRSLIAKTERYCVVMQTLVSPPRISTDWGG